MNACFRPFAFLLLASTALCGHAQQPAPQPSAQILLDVLVTDKSGKPVSGLGQQDFTVLDNKAPAPILAFRAHNAADVPPGGVDPSTEVILVLDEVNTSYDRVRYALDNTKHFLLQNKGQLLHPVSLGIFTDSGLQLQTRPAVDGVALAAALDGQQQGFRSLGTAGTGQHGAEDRLKFSLDALDSLIRSEQGKPGRKVVIWIGPGWPLLSDARTDITESVQARVFRQAIRLSTALRQARILLYSIDNITPGEAYAAGPSRVGYYQLFLNPLTASKDAAIADLSLQVLDTQTGGRPLFGDDLISNSLNRCFADLAAFYTLTIPAAPADKPSPFHTLQVAVPGKDLTVRTRNGYYAAP